MENAQVNARVRAITLVANDPQEALVYAVLDVAAAIRETGGTVSDDKQQACAST